MLPSIRRTPTASRAPAHYARHVLQVEHTLLVAFERLSDAQVELSLQHHSKSQLESQLHTAQQQISQLQRELRDARVERSHQQKLLTESSKQLQQLRAKLAQCGSGTAHLPVKQRGLSDHQQQRLRKLQEAKAAELKALDQKLQGAHEAAAAEARGRKQADRRAGELQRQVVEVIAALHAERERNSAVDTECEQLRRTVHDLQLELEQQTVMLEAEQQMRLALQSGDSLAAHPILDHVVKQKTLAVRELSHVSSTSSFQAPSRRSSQPESRVSRPASPRIRSQREAAAQSEASYDEDKFAHEKAAAILQQRFRRNSVGKAPPLPPRARDMPKSGPPRSPTTRAAVLRSPRSPRSPPASGRALSGSRLPLAPELHPPKLSTGSTTSPLRVAQQGGVSALPHPD